MNLDIVVKLKYSKGSYNYSMQIKIFIKYEI